MRTSLKIILGIGLIILASILILNLTSQNVSADTETWDGGGANALASTKENWVGDVAAPIAGDDIVFNAGALPCTWNIVATMGTFTTTTGYSGVISQSVAFGFSDFLMESGTLTGDNTNWISCSGDLTKTGGTITDGSVKLRMSGTGKTFSVDTGFLLFSFDVTGTITRDVGASTLRAYYVTIPGSLILNDNFEIQAELTLSGTLSIATGKRLDFVTVYGGTYSNIGSISGLGELRFTGWSYDFTAALGTISVSTITFQDGVAPGGSHFFKLAASATTISAITVSSAHGSYTFTLDLNSYSLSATSITVGTRGIILNSGATATVTTTNGVTISANGQANSANINWVVGGNWDSSAGTWNPDEFQVNMTGTSKTLKISEGQTFWDLEISGRITILSTITVDDHLNISGHSTGIYWAYVIEGDNAHPLDIYGTASNAIVLDGTPEEFFIYCASNWINTTINPHPSAGTVWLPKRTTFYYPVHLPGVLHNLTVIPEPGSYANISLCDFGMGSFWAGCDVSDASTTFLWGGWQIGRAYDVSADGIRLGTYVIDANTCLTFYHDSWSVHNMTIVLNGPPIITPANVDSINFFRHVVNEGVQYWLNYTCDQYVAWSLSTNASWISWSSPSLSGTPDYDQSRYYFANLTATNDNGTATVHVFIHVVDAPYGQSTSLLMDVMPVIVGLIIIIPMATWFGMALRRKP